MEAMEDQLSTVVTVPNVKFSFNLGSEAYTVVSDEKGGRLSDQLARAKEESMAILKDFITKHNAPTDVPDEPVEESSEDETVDTPTKKPKK